MSVIRGRVALVTGVTGQDGSYLSHLLLSKSYEVQGIKRRSSSFNTARIENIYQGPDVEDAKFKLHYDDLTDSTNLIRIVRKGEGVEEKGYCTTSEKCLVEIDPRYFRPTEVDLLIGNTAKAEARFGWKHRTTVRELTREMVFADLEVMNIAPIGSGT